MFNSIFFRIFIFALFIMILPAGILGWSDYYESYETLRTNSLQSVGAAAEDKLSDLQIRLHIQNERAQIFLNSIVINCLPLQHKKKMTCIEVAINVFKEVNQVTNVRLSFDNSVFESTPSSPIPTNLKYNPPQLAVLDDFEMTNNERPKRFYYIHAEQKNLNISVDLKLASDLIQDVFVSPKNLSTQGETFLADKNGYFFTKPKFQSTQGHSHPISAVPMQKCLSRQNQEVIDLDYQPSMVAHGFRYVAALGGACIMAHIPISEVLAPLNNLKQRYFIMVIILLLISLILAWTGARLLSNLLMFQFQQIRKRIENPQQSQNSSFLALGMPPEFQSLMGSLDKVFEDIIQEKARLLAQEKAIETSGRLKNLFISSVSHEIRNPLNSLLGIADLLADTELNSEQKSFVDTFKKSGNHLLSIINDILDLSKIEAGQMIIDESAFNLKEIIEETIDLFKYSAAAKKIDLKFYWDSSLAKIYFSDYQRIRQILTNLLSNALKFTTTGSITVSATPNRSYRKGNVLISITDTGMGISSQGLTKLFKPFSQLDNTISRNFGGTGLGLFVTKKLTEILGGEIDVISEVGKGSVFAFTLNLREPKNEIADTKDDFGVLHDKTNPQIEVPMNILLVDDLPENLMIMKAYLKKTKHKYSVAENGEVALQMIKENHFDLIFLDIQMPVMDGYTTIAEIRKREHNLSLNETPVIAATAFALKEEEQKCRDSGFTDYIAKPIKKDKFLKTISSYNHC